MIEIKAKNNIQKRAVILGLLLVLFSIDSTAQKVDSLSVAHRYYHALGLEFRPEYVFPSNSFLKGDNIYNNHINTAFSGHLKYAFGVQPNSMTDRIYKGVYQGIGVAYYNFGESKLLGNPVAAYLYQGARIAELNPTLSFNYEWNFGLSFCWKPYNHDSNSDNLVIGSKANAYINANFYLRQMLSRQVDLIAGVSLTHFSNGNTKIPNAGLNTTGVRLGLVYNINRNDKSSFQTPIVCDIPYFPRHISYDLTLFGSWRRAGATLPNGDKIASTDAYTVLGFNFAPMYNLNYRFRTGLSLDGVYDGSADLTGEENVMPIEPPKDHQKIPPYTFYQSAFHKRLALGVSGRAEYVMPYFTVGIGLGVNILQSSSDLKSFYQLLALKIDVTRNTYLHVGYTLRNFHNPNYLMLGIGIRLHNKRPKLD